MRINPCYNFMTEKLVGYNITIESYLEFAYSNEIAKEMEINWLIYKDVEAKR